MSASIVFTDAVLDALKADAAVAAMVADRVFDQPTEAADYPYIDTGASYFSPGRMDDVIYREEVLQLDIWVNKGGRKWPAKKLIDAVVAVVDGAKLDLPAPYALSKCNVVLARVSDGNDGLVVHGIVQIEAGIETQA